MIEKHSKARLRRNHNILLNEIRKKKKIVYTITMSSESRGSGSQERPRGRATPDDYIFGKLIGEGSFSSVFLAKDIKINKEVAIKVSVASFHVLPF